MSSSFSAGISGYAKRAKVSIDTAVTEVCSQLSISVIKKSPVKSGRFRGNWMSEIGVSSSLVEMERREDSAIAQALMKAELASGKVFYLTNNLPYARRLEYGWSKQAPQGMVRLSVAQTLSTLNGFK